MHPSTVILISFLTSVLTAGGTAFLMEHYAVFAGKTEAVTEYVVPDLRGMSEGDARTSATIAHLTLLVASREPSAEAKQGTVLRQSVAAGQRVQQRDYPVNVVLAEEIPKVPAISGLSVSEATQRLEQRGYSLQIGAKVPDAVVPVGMIVGQAPKADASYAKGGLVVAEISAGPAEFEVPKLIGVPLDRAKSELEKLGGKPVLVWTSLGETPTYVVLNQKPAPGTKAKPGSDVVLTVNR
jgi:eukaryotic-like serine/threonine-protein kinase